MYFISTIFLKNNVDGVRGPQFQICYICDTKHPLHLKIGQVVWLCALYVVGEPIFVTSRVLGFHKV